MCNVVGSRAKMLAWSRSRGYKGEPSPGLLAQANSSLVDDFNSYKIPSHYCNNVLNNPQSEKGEPSEMWGLNLMLIPGTYNLQHVSAHCEGSLLRSREVPWLELLPLLLPSFGRTVVWKHYHGRINANFILVDLVLLCYLNAEGCSSCHDTKTAVLEAFRYFTNQLVMMPSCSLLRRAR